MDLKWSEKAKKDIRKVQKYHKTDKIGPNLSNETAEKCLKMSGIFAKRTHCEASN